MLAEHIARIEDAYDSIQALQSIYTAPHDASTLQQALEHLACILSWGESGGLMLMRAQRTLL